MNTEFEGVVQWIKNKNMAEKGSYRVDYIFMEENGMHLKHFFSYSGFNCWII